MQHQSRHTKRRPPLSRFWLILGTGAIAIAGLFSLLLVLTRTPSFCETLYTRYFHEALVVHVDLSVLVWFLAIACMLWGILCSGMRSVFPLVEEAALVCFGSGTLLIVLSPLDPSASALMSNYIPVITSPLFFMGLALLMCGVALMLLKLFTTRAYAPHIPRVFQFALLTGGLITLIALVSFIWSGRLVPPVIEGEQYFEMLFWGGGHILQFTHTQMLMLCWLFLASAVSPKFGFPVKPLYALFAIGFLCALTAPIAYLRYDITSAEYRGFFTRLMIAGNGIAPTLLALPLIVMLWKSRIQRKGGDRALWASLFMSVTLFLYGGVLGSLIEGQNVVIPAHYHGSIVGVTLAFMGLAYLLLPQFGYREVGSWKLAYWQPIVYGAGQLLHISGLAYSGGYGGIVRKTPCSPAENLAPDIKAAMGLMGGGGAITIIGGLMFVVVMIRAIKKPAD